MGSVDGGLEQGLAEYRVIRPTGDLDFATAAYFGIELADGDGNGAGDRTPCVVVDLTAVTFMDVSPLRELVAARLDAERHGGWLRLVYTQSAIALLLRATRLSGVFPCHASVEDAVAGRAEPPGP